MISVDLADLPSGDTSNRIRKWLNCMGAITSASPLEVFALKLIHEMTPHEVERLATLASKVDVLTGCYYIPGQDHPEDSKYMRFLYDKGKSIANEE